jgi:hypothetical protein
MSLLRSDRDQGSVFRVQLLKSVPQLLPVSLPFFAALIGLSDSESVFTFLGSKYEVQAAIIPTDS